MKVSALLVALMAAASPVMANADLPKILAIRQNANMTMTRHTTVTGKSTFRSTSTSTAVKTMGGGGGSGGSGGQGMAGEATALHGTAVGASALALAGVVGALAIGL